MWCVVFKFPGDTYICSGGRFATELSAAEWVDRCYASRKFDDATVVALVSPDGEVRQAGRSYRKQLAAALQAELVRIEARVVQLRDELDLPPAGTVLAGRQAGPVSYETTADGVGGARVTKYAGHRTEIETTAYPNAAEANDAVEAVCPLKPPAPRIGVFPPYQLKARAEADHAAVIGKVVRVRHAQIGDGSDAGYRGVDFPQGLLIRVGNVFETRPDARDGLLDTFYHGDALPGQLPADDYVVWFDGPTYLADGTTNAGLLVVPQPGD